MQQLMIISFDSTQQALRAEMLLEYAEIDIDTCPTPKEITAACALSIEFPADDYRRVVDILNKEKVEVKGIYQFKDHAYVEIKSKK